MTEEKPQSNTTGTELPSVAIVIPTYNNVSLLLECLDSVRALDYPRDRVEVIVVDNGSTDRTLSVLGSRFPQVRVISLETNTGFAPACNRGAAEADAQYVAFLNNDAIADPNWLKAMLSALEAGGQDTVCAASRIMSSDGEEVEFDGAGSNLFGAGRPHSDWGWPDLPQPPATGTPLLFASGGAMLIDREVFLSVGGFDPAYFAYFEDVDLGWRLWVLGYRVVYAPDAWVRHIGGATGRKSGIHRRYALWEGNSLATIVKNYEHDNMERVLSAALLLEYRRALLSAGDAFNPDDYHLGSPPDENSTNVERLPKISVAHLAGVGRLNSMLPHLMEERARIQAARKRTDAEILPLLGRAFEPQFAGTPYADAARALYSAFDLYEMTAPFAGNRILLIGGAADLDELEGLARRLAGKSWVALAVVGNAKSSAPILKDGYTVHTLANTDSTLDALISRADGIVAAPSVVGLSNVRKAVAPVATWGSAAGLTNGVRVASADDPTLFSFFR
jgi:GT2 family glycosyltransferase